MHGPLNGLDALHNGDDQDRQDQGHGVLHRVDVGEAEGVGDAGQVDHRGGEHQAQEHGAPEDLVVAVELEHAAPAGSAC